MAGKPIATVTSMHVCPMCNGTVPHVGGPIIGPVAPNILINGKPAAVMGDKCTCVGPPDVIITGNPSVLFNGVPVACMGDMTAHGGTITIGDPTVMISSSAPVQSTVSQLKEIPLPKIATAKKVVAIVSGNANLLKEAKVNTDQLKDDVKKHGHLPDVGFSS